MNKISMKEIELTTCLYYFDKVDILHAVRLKR